MRYNPEERYYASEEVLEILQKAIGDLESVRTDDEVVAKLHWSLEAIVGEYERHHENLRDEFGYWLDEEAM